jgi:hypothetical protein
METPILGVVIAVVGTACSAWFVPLLYRLVSCVGDACGAPLRRAWPLELLQPLGKGSALAIPELTSGDSEQRRATYDGSLSETHP